MIDENMEQLRNLFRNYNVLDVQPAVTARAPDDLTTLQVCVCVCVCVCVYNAFCFIKKTLYTARMSIHLFQMAIIILAVLLFLAAMLFILMNWYYRTV